MTGRSLQILCCSPLPSCGSGKKYKHCCGR
ncbi:MAG: SEC-C metal-binding domain-containing protein [Solirubrobacterales bacterium]